MDESATSVSSLGAWQVEQLRLTLFPASRADIGFEHWMEVMGQPPISETTNRQLPTSRYTAETPVDGGIVRLAVDVDRFHWLVVPAPEEMGGSVPPVVIAPAEGMFRLFTEVTNGFLKAVPTALSRVGIGCVVLQPVDSREHGLQVLEPLLTTIELDTAESRDFYYRINRRKTLESGGLQVNRLADWSVVQSTMQEITYVGETTVLANQGMSYFARAGFDLNTVPQDDGLLTPELPSLIQELNRELLKMIEAGDQP